MFPVDGKQTFIGIMRIPRWMSLSVNSAHIEWMEYEAMAYVIMFK